MNLDGKDRIAPVPFDAAEQVLHQPHKHHPKLGYIPVDYEHQEYPKVIGTNEKGELVIASDELHHQQLLEAADETEHPAVDEAITSLEPVPPAAPVVVPAEFPNTGHPWAGIASTPTPVMPIAEDPNKSEEDLSPDAE